jgi:hypothetical protein
MAAFGFDADDFEVEVGVWPDCWASFECFAAMQTQWRTGMSGATGLDYVALEPVMRLQGIPKAEHKSTFEDIRTMEAAALEVMQANRGD